MNDNTLDFPGTFSIGEVLIRPATDGDKADWGWHAHAQGRVEIPANHVVRLAVEAAWASGWVTPEGSRSRTATQAEIFEALRGLAAGTVEELAFDYLSGRPSYRETTTLEHFYRLKKLEIENLLSPCLLKTPSPLRHLETLCVQISSDWEEMRTILTGLPALRNLSVYTDLLDGNNLPVLQSLAALRFLAVSEPVDAESVRQLSRCASLERLEVHPADDEAAALLGEIKSLRSLAIGSAHITDAGLRAFCQNAPAITRLHVWGDPPDERDEGLGDEALGNIADMPSLEELTVMYQSVTDAGIRYAAPLRSLRVLGLSGTKVTGAGLPPGFWTNFPELEEIHLSETSAGDGLVEGVAHAAKKLRVIDLNNSHATGDCLRHLSDLPELRTLHLGTIPVDASLVHYLGTLPQLRWLALTGKDLRGTDLLFLSKMDTLEILSVRHLAEGDQLVPHLTSVRRLRHLSLRDAGLTDAALVHLSAMNWLESLDVGCNEITHEGLGVLNNMSRLQRLRLFGNPLTDAVWREDDRHYMASRGGDSTAEINPHPVPPPSRQELAEAYPVSNALEELSLALPGVSIFTLD